MGNFTVLTVSKRSGWQKQARIQLKKQTVGDDFPWVVIQEGVNAPPKLRKSNLNASLNAGLKMVHTPYVVFYQDFIDLQPDAIEKLLELVDERTFVTCLPEGDPREPRFGTKPEAIEPRDWETMFAAAPMGIIKVLGGFDEDYDNGWSWDNVNLAERAEILGARFILDPTNRPTLLHHERTDHISLPLNGLRHNRTMDDIRSGKKPLCLNYLD